MKVKNKKRTEVVSPTLSTEAKSVHEKKPWLFKPGNNCNPSGRPKGSRNRLQEDFIKALSEDFSEHGKAVIAKVRDEQPGVYLKVVASLQPKEIDIRDKTLSDMTDQEVFDALAEIRTLKASIASKAKAPKFPISKAAN